MNTEFNCWTACSTATLDTGPRASWQLGTPSDGPAGAPPETPCVAARLRRAGLLPRFSLLGRAARRRSATLALAVSLVAALVLGNPAPAQAQDNTVSNVAATATARRAIQITWTAPATAPINLAVEISDDGKRWGTDRCNVSTNYFKACRVWVGSTATSYTHTTRLGGGAPLYYRIFADYTGANDDTTSNVVSASPWNTPTATAKRAAGDAGNSTIDLSWMPVAALGPHTVTGYGIQVSRDGRTWETLVDNTGNTNTTYVHQGLPRGAFRHYSVRAIAGSHRSGWGVPDDTRTTPSSPGKPVVTMTSVRRSTVLPIFHGSYRLNWRRVDDGAEGTIALNYQFASRSSYPVTVSNDIHTTEDPDQIYVNVSGRRSAVRTIRVRALNYVASNCNVADSCEGAGEWSDPPGSGVSGGQQSAPSSHNARFEGLPESHDGSSAFSFELRFSEAPEGLSYTTVAGGLLDVTGATVTKARRLTPGSNLGWEVTVTPSQSGDIAIRLPARACGEANAVCVRGQPLAQAVAATVPGIPFTAAFSGVPAEHDGTTAFDIRFHLSAEPASLSYRTVKNGLFDVTGGSIEKASRLVAGKSNGWTLRIDPSGLGDVTVRVKATTACDTAPRVCTADGQKLPGDLQIVIAGPAAFSVADAQVREAADATLDFVVTLSKARFTATTVDYATSDDTATAGADYTETSGTLTFGPLETSKTVSVPVLDDAHDEGSEMLTLTLSDPDPSGVGLADATATGTISNTDAMPKAWLGRFGRTVAEQVIGAVEGRFAALPAAGLEVTLAGERMRGGGTNPEARDEAPARVRLQAMSGWLRGGTDEAPSGSRSATLRELLTGSSFALTAQDDGGSGSVVSLWGRSAASGFGGREGDLSLDGEVVSGMLGTDWRRGPWTAGLLISHSSGDGSYRSVGGGGTVESGLTGVYPYGRYEVKPRLSAWGVAGYGTGSLTLTPKERKPLKTDMDLAMTAVGLRGMALEAPAGGGVELAVTSDAVAVRTTSAAVRGSAADGTGNLVAETAEVTRLRLGLEGTWRGLKVGGGEVTPGIEIGARYDGGDAETGFGLDVGAGLSWSDPKRGIRAEVRGRGLLTHESKGFRERGLSGSFAWEPQQGTGRGPKLTLTQTLGGPASGGADALLGRETLARRAANDNGEDELQQRRLELRLRYGFSAFGDRFTSTPEIGLGRSNGRPQMSLGWRLNMTGGGANSLELRLEATRRERANVNADPEHAIGLRLSARY